MTLVVTMGVASTFGGLLALADWPALNPGLLDPSVCAGAGPWPPALAKTVKNCSPLSAGCLGLHQDGRLRLGGAFSDDARGFFLGGPGFLADRRRIRDREDEGRQRESTETETEFFRQHGDLLCRDEVAQADCCRSNLRLRGHLRNDPE